MVAHQIKERERQLTDPGLVGWICRLWTWSSAKGSVPRSRDIVQYVETSRV